MILAIDTGGGCNLALGNEVCTYKFESNELRHSGEFILPSITNLLQQANCKAEELKAIAFAAGPGSFTGIRLAASVTQAISFALNLPVIAISSLKLLAHKVYSETKEKDFLVMIDARMNQVYYAKFVMQSEQLQMIGEPEVANVAAITVDAPAVSGSGLISYKSEIDTRFRVARKYPHINSSIDDLLYLAQTEYKRGNLLSPEEALPEYIRDPVSKK